MKGAFQMASNRHVAVCSLRNACFFLPLYHTPNLQYKHWYSLFSPLSCASSGSRPYSHANFPALRCCLLQPPLATVVTFSSSRVPAATVDLQLYIASPTTDRHIFLGRSPLALPSFDIVRTKIFMVWKRDTKAATDDLLHLTLYAR